MDSNALRMRKDAALLFELGRGYKAAATELGINQQTARDWFYAWRAVGTEYFCRSDSGRAKYSEDTKSAAVRDRLSGMLTVEVMERYGIPNRTIVKRWLREYREREARAPGPKEGLSA